MTADTAIAQSAEFVHAAQQLPTVFTLTDLEVVLLEAMADAEERGEDPTNALAQCPEIEEALAQKLEHYVSLLRHVEWLRDARKAEADRLAARAKTASKLAEWLKERLKQHLELTGQQRIETSRYTVRLQPSPPSVRFDDEPGTERVEAYDRPPAGVPLEYVTVLTLYKVDKRGILASVKADGVIPPGVDIVHGQHLRIS